MSEKSLAELIDEHFDADSQQLPVFNRVALELQKLKTSETATMKQVTDLIMKDQALTSRILQVANSSFFGGLKQVDTLSGAVLRLGINKVASLAMMASQLLAYQSKLPLTGERMTGLWQRAYVCASGARWVVENYGQRSEAETAFLCGLLHDIGELFLLKVLDGLAEDDSASTAITDALIEEVLEAMHCEIGYRLMLKWELPKHYALVARDHHKSTFDEKDPSMAVTRLLDMLCRKLGIGQTADPDIVLAATNEAQVLGLKEIHLAQLEVMIEDLVSQANAMLQLGAG
ncbi:HDOD domain-containing protein [Thiorhodovibrio frisius]|uniref:Putative signal transduction protein n=1 Tax=Thiorhodovibrio frisius TaxID=631362 RepID=H8Z245_9GAMM|nr:HDOD domain-containing protein [Thiorhodovibrio frisius]EIC21570.1 putative signal transduction protein [Thiorhodovibrio frisius]WPL24154.1 HDOD domain protein [Thiorhodovibrio frisius]